VSYVADLPEELKRARKTRRCGCLTLRHAWLMMRPMFRPDSSHPAASLAAAVVCPSARRRLTTGGSGWSSITARRAIRYNPEQGPYPAQPVLQVCSGWQ